MKKRILALTLCVTMFAFGCAKNDKPAATDDKDATATEQTENTETTEDNKEETSEDKEEKTEEKTEETSEEKDDETKEDEKPTVDDAELDKFFEELKTEVKEKKADLGFEKFGDFVDYVKVKLNEKFPGLKIRENTEIIKKYYQDLTEFYTAEFEG